MVGRVGFLFPGQGGYIAGALAHLAGGGEVASVMDTVDRVAAGYGHPPVSPLVLDHGGPTLDQLLAADPDRIPLAVFACSVASAALLAADYGLVPDVVFGHSFGQIGALTVAGALSVADGTRVVCERVAALRRTAPQPGGLLAVDAGAARTGHLLGAVDDWALAVAVENSPFQTVVSGPDQALAVLAGAAEAAGVRTFRLRMPGQFHNPALAPAADEFAHGLRRIGFAEPRVRVYCDVTGGYLDGDSDVRQLLCAQLVRPVRFLPAVRALHADGVTTFIECGARDVLTRLVADCLPPSAVALAPLRQCADRAGLDDLLERWSRQRSTHPTTRTTAPAAAPHPAADRPSPAVIAAARLAFEPAYPYSPSGSPNDAAPAAHAAEPMAATDRRLPDRGPGDGGSTAGRLADGWVAGTAAAGAAEPANGRLPDDAVVLEDLRRLYADALEYPPEVFGDNADLEGDLGIDSLKQTELLGRVLDRYGVTVAPGQLRATEHPTLVAVVALLRQLTQA
jgi:[acyl-carrier-protein] S-malonyltransferase